MKKLTGLLTDPIYLEHDTGQHPENPNRLRVILKELQASEIWDRLEILKAEKADRSMIEMIHDPDYIDTIEREIKSGAPFVGSMDCMVSLLITEPLLKCINVLMYLKVLLLCSTVCHRMDLLVAPST